MGGARGRTFGVPWDGLAWEMERSGSNGSNGFFGLEFTAVCAPGWAIRVLMFGQKRAVWQLIFIQGRNKMCFLSAVFFAI